MDCVDQWLSARKACPVCKWDSSRPMQAPAAQSTAAALAAARNGRGLNVLRWVRCSSVSASMLRLLVGFKHGRKGWHGHCPDDVGLA